MEFVCWICDGLRRIVSGVRCLLGGSWAALGGSWVALGGSWEGLGGFLEASKRHLGPKTVRARIFGRFLRKSEIFGVHLGDVLTSKIVFFGVPRGYPR